MDDGIARNDLPLCLSWIYERFSMLFVYSKCWTFLFLDNFINFIDEFCFSYKHDVSNAKLANALNISCGFVRFLQCTTINGTSVLRFMHDLLSIFLFSHNNPFKLYSLKRWKAVEWYIKIIWDSFDVSIFNAHFYRI